MEHFLEIIKDGEQQFCLMQAFMAYCRLRLVKERINIFIDPDKCLSASKVLPIAVAATLTELEEVNKNLSELDELILRVSLEKFSNDITQYNVTLLFHGIYVTLNISIFIMFYS